jgi:hypothetical protein
MNSDSPTLKLRAATIRPRSSRGHRVNLRTALGHIFNSAALLGLRRQPLDTANHPGGSTCCTCAAAIRRGVGATQNSDCAPLIALTTWTTFENTFFMSAVPLISGRESNPAVSRPINIHPANYCAPRQSSVIPVTSFVFNVAWQRLRSSDGTLGRHGRPDWSVIKSTDPKGLFEGWTDGRGRTKCVSAVFRRSASAKRLALYFKSEPGSACMSGDPPLSAVYRLYCRWLSAQ